VKAESINFRRSVIGYRLWGIEQNAKRKAKKPEFKNQSHRASEPHETHDSGDPSSILP